MRILATALILAAASAASAQTVPNTVIQPNGYGGYTGTQGNRNFDIDPNQGNAAGHFDNRQTNPGRRQQPRKGNCLVDGNGNVVCR